MDSKTLLHAVRDVFVLVPRAGAHSENNPKFWAIKLNGLHHSDIKSAASSLRKDQKERGQDVRGNPSLKVSNLQAGIAQAMGAKSYDDWREAEQALERFLRENGMNEPANLIEAENFTLRLEATQVSERIFNSALPLPEKIFTGVGSPLFQEKGIGLADRPDLIRLRDMELIEWCLKAPDEIAFSNLTRRQFVLHAHRIYVDSAINLIGDNLVIPAESPEFRLYQTDERSDEFMAGIYDLFREEITSSEAGWVDVLPMPGNKNIVFLKDSSGKFDWVIRDQRSHRFSGNPYYPVFHHDDLPSAMDRSRINAHLYFSPGRWLEHLEHTAEKKHYERGGSTTNWPGYEKLIEKELIHSRGYRSPSPARAAKRNDFRPHSLPDYCLMVSHLITIRDIQRFLEVSDWSDRYRARAGREIDEALNPMNGLDSPNMPASVSWYDAVAFCKYYEDKTGLPVRLITIDEWKLVSPFVQDDFERHHERLRQLPPPKVVADGKAVRFCPGPQWIHNKEGARFVDDRRFGEWLADCIGGHAPAASVATGESILLGPIERCLCPAGNTMQYKSCKIGFRLCYVADHDA